MDFREKSLLNPVCAREFIGFLLPGKSERDDVEVAAVLATAFAARALPPLPEQHRIVAKIEALFSELDAGQPAGGAAGIAGVGTFRPQA